MKRKFYYLLAAFIAMLPLTCGYIMNSGIIGEWIARVDELSGVLRGGGILLFPSQEALAATGGQARAMNSNLWFLLPALISGGVKRIVLAWGVYLFSMQALTLLGAYLLFRRLFGGGQSGYPVFFGVLLYMTCPYRIYISYDLADMSQVAFWSLLPFYLWGAVGIAKREKLMINCIAASLSLAGMAYADLMQMLVVTGFSLLVALCSRRWLLLPSLGAGCLAAMPCLLRLAGYLFRGDLDFLGIPVESIMGKGYVAGEFFNSFAYKDGHPGMGLGMLASLLAGLWLMFVKAQWKSRKECTLFGGLAGLLLCMSLACFPWEFVQRLGEWALKAVSLFGTPAVFFGMAQAAFCVPAAWAMGQLEEQEEKVVSMGLPLAVILVCLGCCVYQCNMITYARLPWGI